MAKTNLDTLQDICYSTGVTCQRYAVTNDIVTEPVYLSLVTTVHTLNIMYAIHTLNIS